MKSLSTGLQAHLQGGLTTLAELVKITRVDGTVIGFTTHDRDLVVEDVTYAADGSFSGGSLKQSVNLKESDYDISGILGSESISEEDIRKGLYDHAQIEVFVCNWADLSQGVLRLRKGWLGEVAVNGEGYVASLRGMHDLLQQRVGDSYTPECRYDLGDGRCGINLAALTVSGTVTGVVSRQEFSDYTRGEATGVFNDAILTWTSGANAGAKMEVRAWVYDALSFTLWLPMEETIAAGDTYEVAPGCDKRFATCRARFANGANYGGFPHLPGLGKILDYPDAHS